MVASRGRCDTIRGCRGYHLHILFLFLSFGKSYLVSSYDRCNSVDTPQGGSCKTSAGVSAKHKRVCKDSWQVFIAVWYIVADYLILECVAQPSFTNLRLVCVWRVILEVPSVFSEKSTLDDWLLCVTISLVACPDYPVAQHLLEWQLERNGVVIQSQLIPWKSRWHTVQFQDQSVTNGKTKTAWFYWVTYIICPSFVTLYHHLIHNKVFDNFVNKMMMWCTW